MEQPQPHGAPAANEEGRPMTVSIEFLESKKVWCDWHSPIDPIYEVRLEYPGGGGVKKVEATHATSESDGAIKEWIRYMARDHRRRRHPNVASLCCFRGRPYGSSWWENPKGPRSSLPIRTVALCLGGSHCLVFTDERYTPSAGTFKIAALRQFLEDPRLTVLGIGADVEVLRKEWGIDVKTAVDLRGLVARAKGRDAKEKGMARAGVERMAEMVLDGTKVERKPQRAEQGDWGDIDKEEVMYATSDAYLCFEIGVRCLQITGACR